MKVQYYVENLYDFEECDDKTVLKLKSEIGRSLIFKHVMYIETPDGKGTRNLRVLSYRTSHNFTWCKLKSGPITWLTNRKMKTIIKRCKIENNW